jgi:hypothetical protein
MESNKETKPREAAARAITLKLPEVPAFELTTFIDCWNYSFQKPHRIGYKRQECTKELEVVQ